MPALKILSGLALIIVSLFILTSSTQAATQRCSDPRGCELNAQSFDYKIHAQTTKDALIDSIICTLAMTNKTTDCAGEVIVNGQPQLRTFNNLQGGGAIAQVGSVVAALYTNIPLSSTQYVAYMGENIGLSAKPAYAQVVGSGNGVVRPVLEIWQAMRNLAYLVFIIIFVVIGVMIMLRQKINAQTVISAQAALPSLVIGLILVTFSYFIAALIVDVSFVGIQLVTHLFLPGNLSGMRNSLGDETQLRSLAQNANVFQLFISSGLNGDNLGVLFNGSREQISGLLGGAGLATTIFLVLGALVGSFTGPGGWLGVGLGAGLGAAGLLIIPSIIVAIMLIALFIQMFRLVFGLIGAYIQILVLTLAGPLFILVGSVPGRGGAIGAWWKGLLGNVLVFPAVFAAFLFAGLILGDNSAVWRETTTMPLFSGLEGNFVRSIIAFGILLGTPAIPDMVRGALGIKGQPGIAGIAAGALMGGAGVGQTAVVQGRDRLWMARNQQGRLIQGPVRQAWNWAHGRPTRRDVTDDN